MSILGWTWPKKALPSEYLLSDEEREKMIDLSSFGAAGGAGVIPGGGGGGGGACGSGIGLASILQDHQVGVNSAMAAQLKSINNQAGMTQAVQAGSRKPTTWAPAINKVENGFTINVCGKTYVAATIQEIADHMVAAIVAQAMD